MSAGNLAKLTGTWKSWVVGSPSNLPVARLSIARSLFCHGKFGATTPRRKFISFTTSIIEDGLFKTISIILCGAGRVGTNASAKCIEKEAYCGGVFAFREEFKIEI